MFMKMSTHMLRGLVFAAVCHAAPAVAQEVILGVSEGASDSLNHSVALAKYRPLADAIARGLGRQVNVVFVREFKTLEEGMRSGYYDFVAARPSDYPARALRDHGYRYVATTLPETACYIVAAQGTPYRQVADLKGKRWAMPEAVSYISQVCRAELKEMGVDLATEEVQYMREQGAVAFALENAFADVGGLGSNAGVTRQWEKAGHPVLHKGRLQPFFPVIAHGRFSGEQVEAVQTQLRSLSATEAGRTALKGMGIERFDTASEQRLRGLLNWLDL
jgi:ABC-type phosphate/phosphonate transport system substrate-binding protein